MDRSFSSHTVAEGIGWIHVMIRPRSFLSAILFAPCLCVASFFAGPDQLICGTTATMAADPLGVGETGFWTVLQGNASFANISSPTSNVTGLNFGENILQWTWITPNGSSTDAVSIWCYDNNMPMANAGPDQLVLTPPGTATLGGSSVTAPGVCFCTLISGTGAITNPTDPNTTVSGLGTGWNVFGWNCDNGPCGSTSDEVIVEGTQFIGMAEAEADANAPYYDPIDHRLVFRQQSPSMSITLFDQQGRVVDQLTTPAGPGEWDLSAMPSGLYLAQVRTRGTSAALRFVVSR